jgi:hypothetical protein
MHKTAALILSSFIAMQQSYAQYTGGGNDGFTNIALPKITITDNNAFRGGSNDGFTNIVLPKINIIDNNAAVSAGFSQQKPNSIKN